MRLPMPTQFQRRCRRALTFVSLITAGLFALAASASAIPLEDPGSPGDVIIEPTDVQWVEGGIEEHLGSVFANGLGGMGTVLKSDVWYTNEAGTGQPPAVGETWIGAVHVGVFDPNPGTVPVEFVVKLPPNTTFAIDAKHKIECARIPEGGGTTFIDATGDPAANCPSAPRLTPEGWSLGTRELPKYSQFAIAFPVKSSALLKGATGANGGDKLRAVVRPSLAETKEPYVYVETSKPAAESLILPGAALINCLWNNPNTPGIC
jgi:hypothetical protein